MFNLTASAIQIPNGSGFNAIIYGLIRWVYNIAGNYGLAIVLFTITIRLILLPLDFLNKYLTKRNSSKMAEFKAEDNELKKQYASNPMGYMTARKQMYRRNGYNPAGSSLIMIANLVLTMVIFFSVLGCLNAISAQNQNRQYEKLGEVYIKYEQSQTLEIESDEFLTEIDATYNEYNSSFFWVHNIFRPDTWTRKTPTLEEFNKATSVNLVLPTADDATAKGQYREAMYNAIFTNHLNKTKTGWNGCFILIILSAVTMYFSTQVNMAQQRKKAGAESEQEIEIGYSIRKTKESTTDPAIPQIDPASMGKIMKFVLPTIMIIVTYSATAAFALYIVTGSIIQTSLGFGINMLVNKIIARKERNIKESQPKHPVINPHTRYFKKEYK